MNCIISNMKLNVILLHTVMYPRYYPVAQPIAHNYNTECINGEKMYSVADCYSRLYLTMWFPDLVKSTAAFWSSSSTPDQRVASLPRSMPIPVEKRETSHRQTTARKKSEGKVQRQAKKQNRTTPKKKINKKKTNEQAGHWRGSPANTRIHSLK